MPRREKVGCMTATAALAAFVHDLDDPPSATIDRAKLALRDYLGVARAARDRPPGPTLRRYADALPADGPAHVLDGTTASHERAALLNGAFGHALDYDDTFAAFPLHPTTVVVPAALAAAELVADERDAPVDGERLLRAYVAGVEVLHRVGTSVFPTQYRRGFHSTAAVGPLGAAAAAGVVLDVDRETHRRALGVAASRAGGLRRNFGTTTKPLHAGFAASAGLGAAVLAREGATADRDILDGPAGYGRAMAGDDYDPSALDGADLRGVGDVALKLYPSAHITHGAVEAVRQVRAETGLTAEDVTTVRAAVHPGAEDVLHDRVPTDGLAAKFSLPYCLAATLATGDLGLAAFADERVAGTSEAALSVVRVEYDADAVADLGRYGARVVVETAETRHERTVVDAPGSPRNPVAEERLRGKFDACLADTPIDADRLATAVDRLETGTVADLLATTRGA
jgi:2-methylcitrate dehydratase PrpD